jgi:hypothetical protein
MAVCTPRIWLRSSQLLLAISHASSAQHQDTARQDAVGRFQPSAHRICAVRIATEREAHAGGDHHTAGDLRADQRHESGLNRETKPWQQRPAMTEDCVGQQGMIFIGSPSIHIRGRRRITTMTKRDEKV